MSDFSTTEIGLYLVAGLYGVKEFIVPVVKGSFARNLQAKDDQDKETKKKLDDHEQKLAELKSLVELKPRLDQHDEKLDEHEQKLSELKSLAELKPKVEHHEHLLNELKVAQNSAQATLTSQLGAIDGRLTALDTRIEKQGLAHDQRLKDGLADVTMELNRRLTTTLNSELERTVREVLREELKVRKKRV